MDETTDTDLYVRPRIEPTDHWYAQPAMKVLCPYCGDSYQHHGDVHVYERLLGEDGTTMRFEPGKAGVETSFNPSPRRDAVRIFFRGECDHEWVLDVVQHKGETFLFASPPGE